MSRMYRMETGNLGDYTSVRGFSRGLLEARIHSDPALRLYFARTGKSEFGLVWGGEKLTQINDIKKATALWKEYLNPSS